MSDVACGENSKWGRERSLAGYRHEQARIFRRRLYPMTLFYSTYSTILWVLALRSERPATGLLFFLAGALQWTFIEYLSHRYILHGRFSEGKGLVKQFLHTRLDPLHWEHHARPFDGMHINGTLRDTLPLFAIGAPLSLIAPVYTLPIFLAGVVQSYVLEEWIHHSVHFYHFRNRYFRYIKRHHWYHHGRHGSQLGYGLTSGFWDIVFRTR